MPRNRSKPKMKLKTHRGAAKRFKITGTGKLIRMHSGKRHLLGTKAPKRMRKLKKLTQVNDALRAVMLEGSSLADVAWRLGILLLWAAGTFFLALKWFRWR